MIGSLEAIRGNFSASLQIERLSTAKSPDAWGLHTMAHAQIRLGDLAGADKTIDNALRMFPIVGLYDGLHGIIAVLRNDAAGAEQAIEKINQNRKAFGHFHHVEFDVACILATLGRKEEALTWLRSAVRDGYPCLPAVEGEPLFAPLRAEPDYQALIAELRGIRDHYRQVFEELRNSISSY